MRLAYALALSLRASQTTVPFLAVGVTPGTSIPDAYRRVFDAVIDIPGVDEASASDWKLENEWKAYAMTPYVETIKLDADMLIPSDLTDWWQLFYAAQRDVWPCTTAVTYRGEVVTSDFYRTAISHNDLPNVYSGFMYFKQSVVAKRLFALVELIFHEWTSFAERFLNEMRPDRCSTDVAFALAMKLLGLAENNTESWHPGMVHMKTRVQNWYSCQFDENWLTHIDAYLSDDLVLKVGAHRQVLPFHYHLKDFMSDDIIQTYERKLGMTPLP